MTKQSSATSISEKPPLNRAILTTIPLTSMFSAEIRTR